MLAFRLRALLNLRTSRPISHRCILRLYMFYWLILTNNRLGLAANCVNSNNGELPKPKCIYKNFVIGSTSAIYYFYNKLEKLFSN